MLCADMHSLHCICSLYVWPEVLCNVRHATSFLFDLMAKPDTSDMNEGCRLCIALMCMRNYLLLGPATFALGVTGFAPLQCDLSVVVKLQAASSLFTQTEDSSTDRQPARAASARRSRACLPCAWFGGQVPACA